MHPLNRLRSNRPGNMNLLLRILHLKPKSSNNPRNRTPQLRARKVLPNTRTLAMQESDLGEIRRRPTGMVNDLLPILIRVDPPVRTELLAVGAPELGTAVDGIWTDQEVRSLGHGLPGDSRIADRFPEGCRDGWIQTEDFLADAVEERESLQVGPGDWVVAGGDVLSDFCAEAFLDVWVLGEQVAGPGEGTGGGFVLGGFQLASSFRQDRDRW